MNHTLLHDLYAQRAQAIRQPESFDALVVNALRYIIQHVLSNIANSIVITLSATRNVEDYWFQDIISKLFVACGLTSVQLISSESERKMITIAGRRFNNLVFVDSFESLRATHLRKHNANYDSLEYYIIFLQIRDQLMPMQREMILKYCLENYWLHCNVMIQTGRGEILIYTYFPFQENSCYQTHPVLINMFKDNKFVSQEMFPNKLKNLQGCPLKLTTWHVPPFVKIKPNQTIDEIAGMEILILKQIGKELNFTLELDRDSNVDCPTDALDVLTERKTNISVGFFRRTNYRDLRATSSYYLYHLPLIPVLNQKKTQFDSLDVLTYPFDRYTWIMLAVCSFALILINSVKSKQGITYNRWHIIEALLGAPASRVPPRLALRTSFIIWILTSFIIRSLYQSILFYLYRIHFYKNFPETMNDLWQDNYVAVCSRPTEPFLHLILDNSLPLIVLNSTNEMDPLHYVQLHSDQNLMAMSAEDFVIYFVANERRFNTILSTPSEVVNHQQISFYFPKHSYLIERFNEYILRLHQSLLLERFRKQALASKRVRKVISSTAYEKELIINMKQFFGFIKVILILHAIALSIFVLELMSQRVVILKKIF